MSKPLNARFAEWLRGTPGATANTLEPLPRPKTVPAGKVRLCVMGYQHW